MVGDMDNTGSLNAQIIHQLTSAVRSKIAIQVCRLVEETASLMFCLFSAYSVTYLVISVFPPFSVF